MKVNGKSPSLDKAYFVSPDAAVFGEVIMEIGVAIQSNSVFNLVWNYPER